MARAGCDLIALALVLAVGCRSPEPATAPERPAPAAFAQRALQDNGAWQALADLVAVAPRRLTGSEGAERAVQWAAERFRAQGADEVRLEPVRVPRWVRGEASAAIVGEAGDEPLSVLALGGSVATPEEGILAEVVMVRSFDELRAQPERARGRIVFFNRPMPRALANTFQAYSEAVPQRGSGAIEASKAGGVAALVRSLTTQIDDFPHTGSLHYEEGVDRVPAAAISTLDAEMLAARLLRGERVVVRLRLSCATLADVVSHNVVAELRGRELPDEVVLIGAHLDAWDVGHGAQDDGAGCAHVLEAMRLIRALGLRPRRTIRAVLFINEENGLRGAHAYAERYAKELGRHFAAIESDRGGGPPVGFDCNAGGDKLAAIRAVVHELRALDCGAFVPVPGGAGGADIGVLRPAGVTLMSLITNTQRYFDYHHSERDLLATIHERELALGAAALAFVASSLAELDQR
jgi:hypothetical protein